MFFHINFKLVWPFNLLANRTTKMSMLYSLHCHWKNIDLPWRCWIWMLLAPWSREYKTPSLCLQCRIFTHL